jgi:dsDNA-specific endonuclease/ATPase MutS2
VETKRTIQRINQTRSWFFEEINKIDKPLARLTRRHRDSILTNKIRNEKGDITESEEIQKKLSDPIAEGYTQQNWKTCMKMNKFLDRYQTSKLNQGQINGQNSPTSPKEIEKYINSLPTKSINQSINQKAKIIKQTKPKMRWV